MKSWMRGGVAALVIVAGAASAADYVVLTSGELKGGMTVTESNGGRDIAYSFVDRGRGPDVKSRVVVGPDGNYQALSVDGVNYYKLPVAERFERKGGTASWKAANDSGSVASNAFYLPSQGTPEHAAILARALLKAPGRTLKLLPAGEARLSVLTEKVLTIGSEQVPATLYAIHGLGFSPSVLWLDKQNELVFEGDDWFATVKKGLEPQAKELTKLQRDLLAEAAKKDAPKLMTRPTGPVAITNVSLFDAKTKTVQPGMTVLIEGNRIAMVAATAASTVPAGATQIDGTGKTLLPGLWDMHVHLNDDADGLLHLASGVTGVRDMGNNPDELAPRTANFDSLELIGPRVVAAGFIDGPGPLAGPFKMYAETPDELRAYIDYYAKRGHPQIKLYSSLKPELVKVAAEEAHKRGMRLSGHVPAGMTMRQAVGDGYDEVQHLNFSALNFMSPEINAKTNGITRITAIAEHAHEIDPASAPVQDFVKFLKAKKTVIDPTFTLYEANLLGKPGTPNPPLAKIIDRLPPVVRRNSVGAGLARGDAEVARNAKSYKTMQGLLKTLHDGGVTLVPGTDAMPGFTLLRELELYEQAGIPRTDVLYIATLGAATVAGKAKELGSVDAGKLADLLLVDGAPDKNIADLRKATLVIKDGVLFDPKKLYAEIGVAP
ncbi:amidohydrolase family protein [Sphingoaurantiacus capsulatus]|uniref:Amidohydrolase family protein n=1 Tax=Sphingoaurantiacus capsulatus TaxID=1771310 RepID=A0ABV7X5F5_9SPHN